MLNVVDPFVMRTTELVLAATANQVALSLPLPDTTVWEAAAVKGLGVEDVGNHPWMRNGTNVCKVLVLFTTTYELVLVAITQDPGSPFSKLLLTWLPEYAQAPLESYTPAVWTNSRIVGFALITLGAFANLSARYALGGMARSPVVVRKAEPGRPLYVPPSQLPHTPSFETTAGARADDAKNKYRVRWTLRPGHKLVQGGPYGVVRHPMYAGALFAFIGSGLLHLSSGSFVRTVVDQSWLSSPILPNSSSLSLLKGATWAHVTAVILGFAALGTLIGLVRTANKEEEALSDRFDKQWKMYRWNVSKMFIPALL